MGTDFGGKAQPCARSGTPFGNRRGERGFGSGVGRAHVVVYTLLRANCQQGNAPQGRFKLRALRRGGVDPLFLLEKS